MQKSMMIIGASALQVPAILKAKELGYKIILIDYDENAVGFKLGDINLLVSTMDMEEVYRQALIYKPDLVLTSTSDGPVRTAAFVNEKLGKEPDLSYEDAKCATIKSYMRNRLKEHNLPIPEFYIVENYEEYLQAVHDLKDYCIVKPADNAGSRGVVLLENLSEEKLKETYEYSKSNSRNGVLMVEEFMTGPEISVEAMTIEGQTHVITITDKITTPPPFFVELGHVEPSSLSEEVKEQVIEITKKCAKAIGLKNAPSHTEMKITKDGPKIVETAARLGGDFITSKLVPLSTGVDLVGNSILLATRENVNLEKKWDKGAAIVFLKGETGTIRDIYVTTEQTDEQNSIEKLRQIEGIEEIVLYKKVGDKIHHTESSNDRLGHIIATADTAKQAYELAKSVSDKIVITIN